MDVKCVRVLRPYEDKKSPDGQLTLYVDEAARYALNKKWGDTVEANGRRRAQVVIQPLAAMDQDAFVARGDQALIDALFIEYGEEVLLY